LSFSGESVYGVTALSNSDVKVQPYQAAVKPFLERVHYTKKAKKNTKPFTTKGFNKKVLLHPSPFLPVKKDF
jgi:hypothetical protein